MWSIAVVAILLFTAAACSSSDSVELDALASERDALAAERDALAGERDALAAQLAAMETRRELSTANQQLIAEIIADPGAFGDEEEALDAMAALAAPGAVMDDTAFGPVPIRAAWRNTLFGLDAKIESWATWLAEDGSSGGSLWTWSGTARNGEPFSLIGINIDSFDEDGLVTYSLVDWPYPGETVRSAIANGGPG
jgi:methyl-accepting chemotaxis protein